MQYWWMEFLNRETSFPSIRKKCILLISCPDHKSQDRCLNGCSYWCGDSRDSKREGDEVICLSTPPEPSSRWSSINAVLTREEASVRGLRDLISARIMASLRACTCALFFSNLSHQQQDLSLQQIFSISHCDSWDAAGDLIPICGLLHKSFNIPSLLIFTSWSPYALISERRRGREKKAVAVSSKEKSVQVINYLCSLCCLTTVCRTIECCVFPDTVSRVNWEVVHRKGIIEYRSSRDGSQASGKKVVRELFWSCLPNSGRSITFWL